MATKKAPLLKSVLITTEFRGVFYAEIDAKADLTARTFTNLKNCKMAIYWGTTKGVMQLAETGPTSSSKISAKSDIDVLHGITGVFSVTEEAKKVWTQQ